MPLKLYDIPQELAFFEAELLDADGEVTPELEERWRKFVAAGRDKIEAGAMVVRTLEASAEACAAEAKRLKARADSQEKNADRLKEMMISAVDAFGGGASEGCGKIKTSLFTIWTQNSAKTIAVDVKEGTDLEELRDHRPEYVRVVIELNRAAIQADIKAGKELPECITVEEKPGTHYLRIK